jgi:DNA-directed RNA polymerase specialized sigma24 family protein
VAREVEFGEFFASQYPALCRLGYWLTGDWGQAEDLAQAARPTPPRTR